MFKHPVKKSLGLIVLYSVIIIGIFLLQFRNESVVSKNIGLLSASFTQSQNESGEISLKNSLQVSFKGISFTADELTPARIRTDENGTKTEKNLTLVSYSQETPLSITFNFAPADSENLTKSEDENELSLQNDSENSAVSKNLDDSKNPTDSENSADSENSGDESKNEISLTFAVSDTDEDAAFSINAKIPENAEGLFLNYKPAAGFSVTERNRTKLILNSKNLTYAFTASQIDEKNIFFSRANLVSYYVAYNPSVEFSFANLDADLPIMQKSTYEANIKKFRENLVSSVTDSIKNNQNFSEKSVIAFIAEKTLDGKYSEAISLVPDSFKKGNKRTYLSSPFFDSLESMYQTLEMHNENLNEMLQNAVDSSSLSVFAVEDFADYINILGENSQVSKILSLPSTILSNEEEESAVTIAQATGILSTYLKLASLHSALADLLKDSAEKCLYIIEKNCNLTDSSLFLYEKEAPVSDSLALSAGNALIQWGEFSQTPASQEYIQAGYALINSILEKNSLDSVTLADVYPILISNPYYPHFKVLSRAASSTIWAWTCSPSISYTMQDGVATLSLNFPKNETNYTIVSGIAPFVDIEIYGLSFHADPRFEAYNSSGFVYRATKRVLLLKSRHKSETEIVKLSYR